MEEVAFRPVGLTTHGTFIWARNEGQHVQSYWAGSPVTIGEFSTEVTDGDKHLPGRMVSNTEMRKVFDERLTKPNELLTALNDNGWLPAIKGVRREGPLN